MRHSHRRQYQFEGRHNLPKYFFTCTNVTKKSSNVNDCHQKKAKAQGSEIMIGFNKRSFELMSFFKTKGLHHKF